MSTTSPTYLPTYSLAELASISSSDSLIVQNTSATESDVKLLPISTFINTFVQEVIDDTTIDDTTITLYTSMGWETPT